jgi:putative membrane protein
MISFIISLLISAVAVVITAYILPGVEVKSFGPALWAALLIGFLNAFIKPIMILLTLPITIITLGLFLLVINALLILLVSAIVPGFKVNGLLWAILFSIVLSLVNGLLHWLL